MNQNFQEILVFISVLSRLQVVATMRNKSRKLELSTVLRTSGHFISI